MLSQEFLCFIPFYYQRKRFAWAAGLACYLPNLIAAVACMAAGQCVFRTRSILWRYAESSEYLSFLISFFLSVLAYLLTDYFFLPIKLSFVFEIAWWSFACLVCLSGRLIFRIYRKKINVRAGKGGDIRRD